MFDQSLLLIQDIMIFQFHCTNSKAKLAMYMHTCVYQYTGHTKTQTEPADKLNKEGNADKLTKEGRRQVELYTENDIVHEVLCFLFK